MVRGVGLGQYFIPAYTDHNDVVIGVLPNIGAANLSGDLVFLGLRVVGELVTICGTTSAPPGVTADHASLLLSQPLLQQQTTLVGTGNLGL